MPTTALLAVSGLLALPAALLLDQARLRGLAAAVLALAGAGFALAVASVWWVDHPEQLGKSMGTVTVFAAALAQTAALAARRREHDPGYARGLFALSFGLAFVVAAMISAALWAELDYALYFRILGSLAVLDVLVVALQPLLALARPATTVFRMRILVEPGEREVETTVEAPEFASAVAKAIRGIERNGRRVSRVDRS